MIQCSGLRRQSRQIAHVRIEFYVRRKCMNSRTLTDSSDQRKYFPLFISDRVCLCECCACAATRHGYMFETPKIQTIVSKNLQFSPRGSRISEYFYSWLCICGNGIDVIVVTMLCRYCLLRVLQLYRQSNDHPPTISFCGCKYHHGRRVGKVCVT